MTQSHNCLFCCVSFHVIIYCVNVLILMLFKRGGGFSKGGGKSPVSLPPCMNPCVSVSDVSAFTRRFGKRSISPHMVSGTLCVLHADPHLFVELSKVKRQAYMYTEL